MTSFSDLHLTVPDRVLTRAVDDTVVLIDSDSGRSFTLDQVGARVWTLLTSSPSIQAAYDALLREYRVEPERLRRDLQALIDKLRASDLVEAHQVQTPRA
jgi:hypothetical protein